MACETAEAGERGTRRRVLLLAYACSPYRGSEPGAGWHRAVEIAKHFDTWVLCKRQDYEEDIRRYLDANPGVSGLKFSFVPNSRLEILLKRVPGLWYLAYNLWHRRAYRHAVGMHERLRFDIVHQVTLCGFREPGYLWKLGVPFVWGPVGGTQNYPWRLLFRAGVAAAIGEGFRSLLNNIQFRFSLRVRAATRRSAALLAANETAAGDFANVHRKDTTLMPACGAEAVLGKGRETGSESDPLRILWCGVFEHRKALHLLIDALRPMPDSVPYELRILGTGPLEGRWRRLARRAGIEPNCKWLGWVSHEEIASHFDWADVLAFTSMRDTTPLVLVEALGRGVPVICADHQGGVAIVGDDCGIRIPVTTPREFVSALREAIISLARDRARLHELGRRASEHAERFLWSRQGCEIAQIYEEVLRHRRRNQAGA